MKFSTLTLTLIGLLDVGHSFAPTAFYRQGALSETRLHVATDLDSDAGTVLPQETTVAAVPKVAQRWRKSTKQLVTLGPASSSREMIEKLFLAGADLFRLNFSHGSQEQKKELLMTIREIEEKYSHPIGILGK